MSVSAPTTLSAAPAAVTIRPFTPDDYAVYNDIQNGLFPDYVDTVEEMQFGDARRDPKTKWARFLAIDAQGAVVGGGQYSQSIDMYHPQKFEIECGVRAEHQGRGYGAALHDHLLAALAPFEPILVRAHAREDYARSVRFLTERGYVEEMRDWESRLTIADFDFAPWAEAEKRVTDQGLVIKSLSELAADPDRDQKLYEMDWAVTLDMPAPDTLTKPTFEHFERSMLQNPNLLPEAFFVALDGDKYVGESALWNSQGSDDLYVGATGVLREYRRRGIALALKIRAIAQAKAMGCPQIKTWNAQSNRPMLSINEALGFVKQPAWISYAKTLREEAV